MLMRARSSVDQAYLACTASAVDPFYAHPLVEMVFWHIATDLNHAADSFVTRNMRGHRRVAEYAMHIRMTGNISGWLC